MTPSTSGCSSARASPRVPGVRSTRTTIVLETVKETPRLPIPKREEART